MCTKNKAFYRSFQKFVRPPVHTRQRMGEKGAEEEEVEEEMEEMGRWVTLGNCWT
jgi:hypothetical protein